MRPTPLALALLCLLPAVSFAHEAADDMVAAANRFLTALSPDLKQKAMYTLTDAERENWHFVPKERNGLPLKHMSAGQRDLALALLKTGLSHRGTAKAEAIMSMELVLKELEKGAPRRDPELYFVTVFGTPTKDKSWGWRFEGHHLSFNFTVVDGKHVFFAPSFIGANPAEVRSGPRKGERVLAEEEDLGRAFVLSLDDAQRKAAVFAEKAPKDIITGAEKRVKPLSPDGISYAKLTAPQRDKLMALVKLYVGRWRTVLADETMAEIKGAGLEKIAFAWAGGFEPGAGTYYRIQGPTFLIEFDNTQNNANHIHTTFREFKGDFGHDLLREHYAKAHTSQ